MITHYSGGGVIYIPAVNGAELYNIGALTWPANNFHHWQLWLGIDIAMLATLELPARGKIWGFPNNISSPQFDADDAWRDDLGHHGRRSGCTLVREWRH